MATITFLRGQKRRRVSAALWLTISTLAGTVAFAQESEFAGLVRGKTQDRGSYVPPTLPNRNAQARADSGVRGEEPTIVAPQPLTVASEEVYEGDNEGEYATDYDQQSDVQSRGSVATASYQPRQTPTQRSPQSQAPRVIRRAGHVHQPMTVHEETFSEGHTFMPGHAFDPACGIEGSTCDGGCDSFCNGCDSCRGPAHVGPLGLFCHTNQWFGAVEVMLMFRSGDRLPVLATGNGGAVLFGGDRYYDDMTAGGRFKIGTWLDRFQCNSLVMRGWGAGQDSFDFHVDSSQQGAARIARPFVDFSVPVPVNNNLLIADPTAPGTTGNLTINGSSEVYGGDIAIHRQWLAGLGGVIEVLYGYQHMRMTEDLGINSVTLPGPVVRREFFEADNEFHGGEFGFAARYREGCWSFDGMIKVAAGSIRRTAVLESSPLGPFSDPLLIRPGANQGRFSSSTFGWVPELDATIGYRYTQNLDFTVGYHVIAITDALQVSGTLDPQLGVNTSFPTPPARPAFSPTYDTFYVQSIHFGLQYVY